MKQIWLLKTHHEATEMNLELSESTVGILLHTLKEGSTLKTNESL